jgi:uncharacterized damage-inducible protein DinB
MTETAGTADATLAAFGREWGKYQDGLVRAIEPLTAEQLALRIAADLRTIGQLATHIPATRAGWMVGALGIGAGQLDAIAEWNVPEPPVLSAAELVAAFNTTWDALNDYLERATSAELDGEVTVSRNGRSYTFVRRLIVWHLLEHDLHHGGELAFSLGAHGLPAPRL